MTLKVNSSTLTLTVSLCGGGEIRTHDTLRYAAFPRRCTRPLCDASVLGKYSTKWKGRPLKGRPHNQEKCRCQNFAPTHACLPIPTMSFDHWAEPLVLRGIFGAGGTFGFAACTVTYFAGAGTGSAGGAAGNGVRSTVPFGPGFFIALTLSKSKLFLLLPFLTRLNTQPTSSTPCVCMGFP